MKIKNSHKSIAICSIMVGILISLQIKILNIENNNLTTSKRGEQLAVELKVLKKEEDELKAQIESIKNNIERYKEEGEDALKAQMKEYQTLAGYTDVNGPGIEIEIYSEDDLSNNIIYNYDLILSIINKLNSAQVNAISINDQRLVASTYFHLKQDSLYMNEREIVEPIKIKAIGDPDILASALQIKYGIVWEIKEYYNYEVDIEKKENIKIDAYNQRVKVEYSHTEAEEVE